jgi:hypothetical protein
MTTFIMKSGLTEKGCVWHDVSDQKSEAVFKLLCELGENPERQEKLLKKGSPVVLHEMGELTPMAWEDRPAVLVGKRYAYAIFTPGGAWKEVERTTLEKRGVPILEAEYFRIFPNADLSTIPAKIPTRSNSSTREAGNPHLVLVPPTQGNKNQKPD